MKVILYENSETHAGVSLRRMIEDGLPEADISFFSSLDRLSDRLRRPLHHVSVAVFLMASGHEGQKVKSMRTLLEDIRTILVLPDRAVETATLGIEMKASFTTYMDSDLQDVVSVLQKISRQHPIEPIRIH
ncbi:MAG: hypothetical protein D3926_22820 [Desulfobacteraceae bacterium]|nr:MAG: hypothetical protein D3926_22820 [Desulfobacteraceae bacterium]